MTKKEENFQFEKGLSRLEEILEKMNSGTLGLEDALKLYEEADGLLHGCNKRLHEAERKIEKLIKKRNGELETDEEGNPLTEDFTS